MSYIIILMLQTKLFSDLYFSKTVLSAYINILSKFMKKKKWKRHKIISAIRQVDLR